MSLLQLQGVIMEEGEGEHYGMIEEDRSHFDVNLHVQIFQKFFVRFAS